MIARQPFIGNLPLKALALALAVLLWLMASAAKQEERNISLPLAVMNMPPGLAIGSRIPREIRITVAGPKFTLRGVHGERTPVLLDLKGLGEGTVTFSGMEKRLRLPPGISVLRVYPANIDLKLVRSSGTGGH
jgi:hypothetical protein